MEEMGKLSLLSGPETKADEKQPRLIHRAFEKLLEEQELVMEQCAVLHSDRCLSFAELNSTGNRLARQMFVKLIEGKKINFEGPKIVGVCMCPSERLICSLMAVLKLGAAYLPIDPAFPASRTAHILAEARPLCVLVENSWHYPMNVYEGLILRYVDLLLPCDNVDRDDNLTSDETVARDKKETALACVLYTSGSSGVPCGVLLPHHVVMNRIRWQWRVLPFTEGEVACFKTVLTFVDSISEIFAPLLYGRTLVVIPRSVVQDPSAFVANLERHFIRRIILVPALLRAILMHVKMNPERQFLPHLRWVISSGEPLSFELIHDFFNILGDDRLLFNFYGSTEVMGDVTFEMFASIEDARAKSYDGKIPIGVPVDNTTIYITDENGEIVPLSERGEICISGAHLSSGYLVPREQKKFVFNRLSPRNAHVMLYHTGDYGFISNKTVYYDGRLDTQVKVRGQRVDMTEIERAVLLMYGVHSAVALCYKPTQPNQTLVLFYTCPNKETTLPEVEVTTHLKQTLAPYMIPFIMKMESFPMLINGKIDRQSLLKQFEEKIINGDSTAIDLVGVTEENVEAATALLTVVAGVLGGNRQGGPITISSNYFEAGGNSLNVMIVLTQLKERGYCIAIADFLHAKSLRDVLYRMTYKGSLCPSLRDYERNRRNVLEEYRALSLLHVQPDAAICLVAECFATKGDLEKYMAITAADFISLITGIWDLLVEANLSFAVVDRGNNLLGVTLNWDAHKELLIHAPPRLQVVMDFLAAIEKPHLSRLPSGPGVVMSSMMMATDPHLKATENVQVILFMEEENLRTAKLHNFHAILTTNTNQLTKDICQNLLDYQTLETMQVNNYVDESGHRVFTTVPNSLKIHVAVKFLNNK